MKIKKKTQMLFEMDDADVTSPFRPGKDEMNFAEHPIALLTDRVPRGQRSVVFEDQVYSEKRRKMIPRRRIIEGSEEYGLPTATDDVVILGLIQLTKQKGNFTQPEVEFTRLELIKMLDWPDEGRSYDRIKLSLLRIKGVNYTYDNAWWDPRIKDWTTRAFNIIDNVEINDSRTTDGQGGLFPSRIKWNEVVFDSFHAGFLRDIDFQLCIGFEHPTARRMYRFLGKRFYVQPEWEFELKSFAYDHMALGRNYEGGTQIARKLQPAIAELEKVGFLEPLPENERFIKKGREWKVRFVQKAPAPALPDPVSSSAQAEPNPLIAALIERGVTDDVAARLVQRYPAERIEIQIDVFDWLTAKQDKKIADNPAGYLVKSITTGEKGYAVPKGFVSKAERQRQAEARQAREREEAEARLRKRQQEAEEKRKRERDDKYWESLTPQQQAELDAAADAEADPAMLAEQKAADPSIQRMGQYLRRRGYIRKMLDSRETLPLDA